MLRQLITPELFATPRRCPLDEEEEEEDEEEDDDGEVRPVFGEVER
jgi:hypothetical protein